jgi:ABC-type multidrug transport system fused ATPase/permease subunit
MGGRPSVQCCSRCTPEEKVELLPKSSTGILSDTEDFSAVISVVQFSCAQYFCVEDEQQMLIDIVRFGDHSGFASCEFHTEEASAKEGERYLATSGEVQFAPHETIKTIGIPILASTDWNACVEFKVKLSRVRGAQPGKYLNSCRVKVIDVDCFPTNKYRQQFLDGQLEHIPGVSLMLEYIKYVLKSHHLRVDTIKCVLMDQLKGVYFFLTMYLQMYLVDVVLAPDEEEEGGPGEGEERRLLLSGLRAAGRALAEAESRMHGEDNEGRRLEEGEVDLMPHVLLIPHHRRQTAMIIGIVYILPMVLMHCIDQYKCYLCIPGEARKNLQANLLRKFMNYKEDIRQQIQPSEIIMAMVRDVVELVDKGYMKVINTLKVTGKLFFALIFVFAENRSGTIPLIVYPMVLGLWLFVRERKTITVSEEKAHRQDTVVHTATDAIHNFQLISGFNLRSHILDDYERKIDDYHKKEGIMCSVVTNNTAMAPWLTTLLVGGYMIFGAYSVTTVGGTVTLGAFLTTINVFKEVGEGIKEIYSECIEIQLSFGPLKKICYYLNLETDLTSRMSINRRRRKEGTEQREMMRAEKRKSLRPGALPMPGNFAFAVDHVKLAFKDVNMAFRQYGKTGIVKAPLQVYGRVSCSWAQGKMYALVGPARQGKGTVLKLLGAAIVTDEGQGDIFVPPHLRIAHVDREATILHVGAFSNIVLKDDIRQAGGIERVRRICQRVGLSKDIIAALNDDWDRLNCQEPTAEMTAEEDDIENDRRTSWTRNLCQTDYARLNLARAFVYNPEVLVLHKPLVDFNHQEQVSIAGLLREHVTERGIELPDGKQYRRPRTVFFTATTTVGITEADEIYQISFSGVDMIAKEDVSPALLV